MKKIKSMMLYSAMAVFALTSCDKDDDDTSSTGSGNVVKSGIISSDEKWTSDKVYELNGRVTVTGGATLEIEAGTVIKARPGGGAGASALLISREGTIMAKGTAAAPIIFTSTADDIQPGEINSPNLDPGSNGFWGGVIILGKAPISASAASVQIEGIPTTDPNGLYGGSEDDHNSGIFTYVSIRHGGTNIGAGNEINGLTLGGVGSGTTINHVEIVGNQDDGIEWFGGTVNVSNAVVWNAGDDAIDGDQEWKGTLDGFIVVNPGDRAFELDGPEGTVTGGNYTITNGTVYMDGGSELIDFDDNTNVDMSNIYFFGLDEDQSISGYSGFAASGQGSVSSMEATLPSGVALLDIFAGFSVGLVSEVGANSNTVGASGSYSWTWASQSGALAAIGL